MRFAIIATPRSGNSVMRSLFSAAYELQEFASHDPEYLLQDFPDNSIVQVHARYDQRTFEHLKASGTIILTPIRHPLDALLSMLHFAQFEPAVNQWLGANYLAGLQGCGPESHEFREFALGAGAADLLGVSTDWLPHANLGVRYRRYANDPTVLLDFPMLPRPIHGRQEQLVKDAVDFGRFRSAPNMHGWLGKPDYWKRFISKDFAQELFATHRKAFLMGNFVIDGAQDLTRAQIAADWQQAYYGEKQSAMQQAHYENTSMWLIAGIGTAAAGIQAASQFLA